MDDRNKRKRTYDWTSFMENDTIDSTSTDTEMSSGEKKRTKTCMATLGQQRMAELVPLVKPPSLMDQSAQSLAQYWTDNDMITQQVQEYASTSISGLLLVQVGLFLHGDALCTLIEAAKGLDSLASTCVSFLFQRFLVHILFEMSRSDYDYRLSVDLNCLYMAYQRKVKKSSSLNFDVHRLGLSFWFEQYSLHDKVQTTLQTYFITLFKRRSCTIEKIHVPYPMPHVLRIDPASTQDYIKKQFSMEPVTLKKYKEWFQSCTKEEILAELKGLKMSPLTSNREQNNAFVVNEKDANVRFTDCLSAIARTFYNEAHHVSIMLALMALVEPFYMMKPVLLDSDNQLYCRRQLFRHDIFTFLTKSLSHFYAYLDLPLACFARAQRCLGDFVSLAEEIRHAVLYQSILVSYGQWESATTLFYQWFYRIPNISSLHQELLVMHAKCIFSQVEDALIEIWITQTLHIKCTQHCRQKYIAKTVLKIKKQLKELDRIAHYFDGLNDGSTESTSHYQLIMYLCKMYNVIADNCNGSKAPEWDTKLQTIYHGMRWQYFDTLTSIHLKPFVKCLPFGADRYFWWNKKLDSIQNDWKKEVSEKSFLETSRFIADMLYSSIAVMIHCIDPDYHCFMAINKACNEYELYTSKRHYRIPLLEKLIAVMGWPEEHILQPTQNHRPKRSKTPIKSTNHFGIPLSKLTVIGTCNEHIKRFCASVKDTHATMQWSNDETFIQYLRQRDQMMNVWMDIGQRTLRLYSTI